MAILVLLVSYEKKKNVLARLKRDETSKSRRSNDVRPPVPAIEAQILLCHFTFIKLVPNNSVLLSNFMLYTSDFLTTLGMV